LGDKGGRPGGNQTLLLFFQGVRKGVIGFPQPVKGGSDEVPRPCHSENQEKKQDFQSGVVHGCTPEKTVTFWKS
jgi:hypothetical protein